MTEKIAQVFKKYAVILLGITWLLTQFAFLYTNSIRTDFEAEKYIYQAHVLSGTGNFSTPNFWLYATEIFLISFCNKIQVGYPGVVIIHMFLHAMACYIFYRFIKKNTNTISAFLTIILLFFIFPFNQYNVFLQTESVFFSLLLIYSAFILSIKKLHLVSIMLLVLLLGILMITRPTGILLLPVTIIYIVFHFFRKTPTIKKCIFLVVTAVLGYFLLNIIMGTGGALNFMLPFQKNMIICGVPLGEANITISTNPNSIKGLLFYINHNPTHFLSLAWLKTKAFFGVYRNYYSAFHNLYLIIAFVALYVLAFWGSSIWKQREKSILLYCCSCIFITWCSVVVTCDDWHNRFLLTIVPYLLILSSKAIEKAASNFNKIDIKNS